MPRKAPKPRKPFLARIAANAELPQHGLDGLWSALLRLDEAGEWTKRDLANATNMNAGPAFNFVKRLHLGGYAEIVGHRTTRGKYPQQAPLYRLTSRPVVPPRLDAQGKLYPECQIERIWRTAKMLKAFTVDELVAALSTPERPVIRRGITGYLNTLRRVGILSGTGYRPVHYRLVRNLGMRAPKVLAGKTVYDPNTGTVVGTVPRGKPGSGAAA